METLPILPGYDFSEPVLKDYKIKQKLKFVNGFRMIKDDFDINDAGLVEYDPTLTYGRPHRNVDPRHEIKRFIPHYVLFDRKTLRFDAYFKQGIFGSAEEHCRVRHVRIMYYLADDTMAVLEKPVDNAGLPQGKLVRKSRIPRPDKPGDFYHWKDLNVAMNIEIYGVVYRIANCDDYTREFLKSQGIDVNEPEPIPVDPYIRDRVYREQLVKSAFPGKQRSLADDKRFLFLEYEGMVLTFDALWNDEPYKVRYFLDDDTISVCESKIPGDKDSKGRLLLKRTKVPKNWKDVPLSYAGVYMERTDEDVKEYYGPVDLRVGDTIFIFGRRFLLYDCDRFTRKYYTDILKINQPDRISLPQLKPTSIDSSNPCKPIVNSMHERTQDVIRRLHNFPKKLRYSLAMEAVRKEDEGRDFVLEYDLSDGSIKIMEIAQRNSGRQGGCFLGSIRVPKPGAGRYYTPEDFRIGERLNVFGHWFVVTGTEPYVYKYMRQNPRKFDDCLVKNVRDHLRARGLIGVEDEDEVDIPKKEKRTDQDPQSKIEDCKEPSLEREN